MYLKKIGKCEKEAHYFITTLLCHSIQIMYEANVENIAILFIFTHACSLVQCKFLKGHTIQNEKLNF